MKAANMAESSDKDGIISRRRRLFDSTSKRIVWAIIVILIGAIGYGGWYHLLRRVPEEHIVSNEEHFKYGSLSTRQGFPLYILEALPELFADKMPAPGDWTGFGFTIEDGKTTPIGWAERTVGFPGITFNCALCHTGSYRSAPTEAPHLVVGAPAGELDFSAFQEFLFSCVDDPRFTATNLLAEMEKQRALGLSEKLAYRFAIIPGIKHWLRKEKSKSSWTLTRPSAGPGRQDAFNILKFNLLDLADDGSTSNSDFLPLWHQQSREGMGLHWNGSGTDLIEENLISAFSVVAAPKGLDEIQFERVRTFLLDLPAPKFPFDIDAVLAEQGKLLYEEHCASCHAFGSPGVGKVTPGHVVGTDPEFLSMMTPDFVAALEAVDSPPFKFSSVRITDGYVNIPLDGCWMRAPYLHNGSVPTLADLLEPPDRRPTRFTRGGILYNPERMGFEGPALAPFEFDTTLRGNGNGGHSYGTSLEAAEKKALLEYLKTL